MCGIYFSFDYDSSLEKNNWKNIQHRGPDNSISLLYSSHFFGFHRLALQDTVIVEINPLFKILFSFVMVKFIIINN